MYFFRSVCITEKIDNKNTDRLQIFFKWQKNCDSLKLLKIRLKTKKLPPSPVKPIQHVLRKSIFCLLLLTHSSLFFFPQSFPLSGSLIHDFIAFGFKSFSLSFLKRVELIKKHLLALYSFFLLTFHLILPPTPKSDLRSLPHSLFNTSSFSLPFFLVFYERE